MNDMREVRWPEMPPRIECYSLATSVYDNYPEDDGRGLSEKEQLKEYIRKMCNYASKN